MMQMLKRLLFCAALVFAPSISPAQSQSGIAPVATGKTISVTSSSSSVTMGSAGSTVVVWNTGSNGAYYCVCATATTANPYLPAGAVITLSIPSSAVIAAITASSTTTLQITQGFGWPSVGAAGGSGGGSGGDVNLTGINGTAPGAANPLFVTAVGIAPNTVLGAQTGSMILGSVLTNPPTYTTGNLAIPSLDLAGGLRTSTLNNGVGATAAAVPANASYTGLNVGGNLVGQVGDPCQTVVKTYTPISITTATTTRIVAPTASKKTYICYMYLQTTAANNIAVVEGTGGTCGSGTAGIVGGTTAANGLNNAANSGQAFGNGGFAALATAGTNVDLCLITSAATPLAGHVVWVAQ